REFPTTLKVMKAHPSGHDEFKPHERSSSALRLAYTFMMENGAAIKAVRGELTTPLERPPMPATFAEAVASYERGARELIAAIEKMPESRLSERMNFGPLTMIPVGELLWFLLLDSIYGPSADEPWTG